MKSEDIFPRKIWVDESDLDEVLSGRISEIFVSDIRESKNDVAFVPLSDVEDLIQNLKEEVQIWRDVSNDFRDERNFYRTKVEMMEHDNAAEEVTATLKRACWYGGDRIYGFIYGDTKQRWADGTPVTTSRVVSWDGEIATTLNSRYRIEWGYVEKECKNG